MGRLLPPLLHGWPCGAIGINPLIIVPQCLFSNNNKGKAGSLESIDRVIFPSQHNYEYRNWHVSQDCNDQ